MNEHTGGTVRYHRAEWQPNGRLWHVWFTESACPIFFSAEDGEAMGLTVPEPAPLVVTKPPLGVKPRRLHDEQRITEVAAAIVRYVEAGQPVDPALVEELNELRDRLLRDARQDPQPASDEPTVEIGGQVMTQAQYDAARFPLIDTETHPVGIAVSTDPQPEQDDTPGECLRGLLAGRDDADFLLAEAQTFKRFDAKTPVGQWLQIIGAAAREVHG